MYRRKPTFPKRKFNRVSMIVNAGAIEGGIFRVRVLNGHLKDTTLESYVSSAVYWVTLLQKGQG